jgi:hypothetical protein
MPTIATERPLMIPGSLVMTTHEVRAIPPFEVDGSHGAYPNGLPAGTVGIIIQRPNTERPRQFLVQFVGGNEWWMYTNEIEPHIL